MGRWRITITCMTWQQTLVVALIPAAITAASLIIQSLINNSREAKRLKHEEGEREKERKHAEAMADRVRAQDREDAESKGQNKSAAQLRALHVEMLTAMDEIYNKLLSHRRLAEGATPTTRVFLVAEPGLTRLNDAFSVLRIECGRAPSTTVVERAVNLLIELHNMAAATDHNPNLTGLESYPGLRTDYLTSALTEIHGR